MQAKDWVEFVAGGGARTLGRIESVAERSFSIQPWVESACGTLVSVGGTVRVAQTDAISCPCGVVAVGEGYMYADEASAIPRRIVTAPDLDGFIVDDADEFAPAQSQSSVVRETHAAVREWEGWFPTQPEAKRYKAFVEGIEGRAALVEEDRAFRRGTSVNHRNPPA